MNDEERVRLIQDEISREFSRKKIPWDVGCTALLVLAIRHLWLKGPRNSLAKTGLIITLIKLTDVVLYQEEGDENLEH
jgi:hypothetical protein